MGENVEKFASLMANRMKKTASAAVPNTLELGVVSSNLAIIPDNFRVPIPKGEYMVNLMLTGDRETAAAEHEHSGGGHGGHSEGDGSHSHSGGSHSHELPKSFRGLQAGDRILIAWCGNEPVVIAIVVSS